MDWRLYSNGKGQIWRQIELGSCPPGRRNGESKPSDCIIDEVGSPAVSWP